jgi:hypothetical protein
MSTVTLLPNEQRAKDFVSRIGIERAERLLTMVCNRVERRIRMANSQVIGQFFDDSCIKKYEWEVTLTYELKMGLQLLNTDTPAKARERIVARRKARKALREQRRLERACA